MLISVMGSSVVVMVVVGVVVGVVDTGIAVNLISVDTD